MVTQGNETCIQLNGVVRSGFSERSNTIYIKGTWYPMHFLLLITDGIDAWRFDATENVVTLRARSLRLTESEYVDKAHSYLGQQHASSLYSLHRTSSEAVQLMCTPTDKQYTVGFNLELILKKVPAVSITFDMLQFLMQAHRDLLEQSDYKTRMFERTKAAMEKTIVELQKEKHEMESEPLQLKTGEEDEEEEEDDDDVGAMTVISAAAAAKRKRGEHTVEKKGASVREKPLWSFSVPSPPSLPPPPAATSKALPRYSNGSKEISKSGSKARRGIMTPTKIISKPSVSETKYGNSWGAQPAKFSVVGAAAGHSEEHQTAEEEDDDDDEDDEGGEEEDEGDVEGSQFAAGDLAFTEQDYQLMNAHKGRRATGSTKEGSRSTASHSKVKKGDGSRSAAISISKKKGGDIVVSADPIEEQAVKSIKLLVPFTTSGSTGGQDGEKKKRRSRSDEKTPNPSKKRGRPSDPGSQHKQSSKKKKAGSLQWISSQAESAEANSRSPNASLVHDTDDVQQPFGVVENNNNSLAIMPVNHEQKKFNVISADIHDFDSDRTEKAMALHQFWALYDDKDGMPRFYGRITKLRHSPFEVNVQWLEPYRPVVRRSGLVKSAALSTSCGVFVLATECSQTLAAFSHRVEIEEDVSRGTFQLYPKKGEVWALYRNWSKPKPEKVADTAADEEEDNVKFEYELVEVHSDYSKEKGVKVTPIFKVSGFTALFKSGGYRASIAIPAKDVPSRFSHRILTYQNSGDEKPGVPKDSLELDPAATPPEYLKQSPNGYGDGVDNVPAPEVEALQTVSESG
ncbi:unnamed protein product [Sphagnum compactum]